MCNHRTTASLWWRIWATFTGLFLGTFSLIETYGLITEGTEGTWSYWWRQLLGQLEPCRHSHLGRFVIVAFCAWLAAHLGWGKFGVVPRRPRHRTKPLEATPCSMPHSPRPPSSAP